MQKGAGNGEAFVILAVIIVITLVGITKAPKTSTTTNTGNESFFSFLTNTSTSTPTNPPPPSNSALSSISSNSTTSYTKNIYIGTGNAAYSYQPYDEYITITNSSSEPINITGWQLKNGKGERAYDSGSGARYFPSDMAVIPQGALFISPFGSSPLQNIVLKNGEMAIITTGQVPSQSPYRIVSFKENICSAYLENMPEYNFTPALSYNCPRPANEPGVSGLSTECRQFIERMPYCRTPDFNTRDASGEICNNCVDGTPLSNSCVAFIKSHFSYNGCVANHLTDPGFSLNTWRIFLGKGWEMWADKYETIEVFDQLGRLITKYSY